MAKREFCLILLFVFLGSGMVQAQEVQSSTGRLDSEQLADRVLLLPMSPSMYIGSGDQFILKHEGLDRSEYIDELRRIFTNRLEESLIRSYKVVSLLNCGDSSEIVTNDFYRILQTKREDARVGYYSKITSGVGSLVGSKMYKWGTDCTGGSFEKPNAKKRNWNNMGVSSNLNFITLCNKYLASYVVVISGLEVSTRYQNCLELANNVYQRDVFVHFVIFDSFGTNLGGSVLGVTLESNSNSVDEVFKPIAAELSISMHRIIKEIL